MRGRRLCQVPAAAAAPSAAPTTPAAAPTAPTALRPTTA
eukprot:SAG22_NODE_14610_length_370_cov_0.752768_1_plen_38_part_10